MGIKEILINLEASRDKEIYYSCPEELKSNFYFIVEVIEIFKDDFDFIMEVAESYLKYIPKEEIENSKEYLELSILLGENVPEGHPYYEYYKVILECLFAGIFSEMVVAKDYLPGVSDCGFSLLMNVYKGRENVLNYFAKRLIECVYYHNSLGSLEELVHKNYEDFGDIVEEGYEEFFIRNLTDVDYSLGEYLASNMNLLEEVCERLDYVGNNWEHYEEDYTDFITSLVRNWLEIRKEAQVYGEYFDYEQSFNEVLVSERLDKLFGLDRHEVLSKKSNIINIELARFRRDLRTYLDKIFPKEGRLTMTEMSKVDIQVGDNSVRLVKGCPNER